MYSHVNRSRQPCFLLWDELFRRNSPKDLSDTTCFWKSVACQNQELVVHWALTNLVLILFWSTYAMLTIAWSTSICQPFAQFLVCSLSSFTFPVPSIFLRRRAKLISVFMQDTCRSLEIGWFDPFSLVLWYALIYDVYLLHWFSLIAIRLTHSPIPSNRTIRAKSDCVWRLMLPNNDRSISALTFVVGTNVLPAPSKVDAMCAHKL